MGFTQAVKTCLRKTFVLSGRAPRSEYWWFVLFYVLYFFVAGALAFFVTQAAGGLTLSSGIVLVILGVPAIWFYVAAIFASVRRLHDRGFSGWWIGASIIIGFLPSVLQLSFSSGALLAVVTIASFVLSIAILVMTILRGTPGPNKFGEDPLGYIDEDVFA